jgi:hypothetical protein
MDIDTRLPANEAITLLRSNLTPLTVRTRLELVTRRSFSGVVNADRIRIWPIGPSGGEDGAWHQLRPVFEGQWIDREERSHLVGRIALNRGAFVVAAAVVVILGAWLFAGVRAVFLGLSRGTWPDPMLLLAGVAMPFLFAVVAIGILGLSYQLYRSDRAELEQFLIRVYEKPGNPV